MESDRVALGAVTLPEQYFGKNSVTLHHHASGTLLSFDARGAIGDIGVDPPAPLHVRAAREWLAAHREEVTAHDARVLEYDWTFTTGYRGGTNVVSPEEGENAVDSTHAGPSRWAGSGSAAEDSDAAHVRVPSPSAQWISPASAYDRTLLLARDPILLFGSVVLYESELEDNGIASATVRVRVMPQCWFVLFRFFLRVDGVAVRVRETRLYCAFDSHAADRSLVTRETTHSEGTFQELRRAGAPCTDAAFSDGDAAAAALAAAAPSCTKLYNVERLALSSSVLSTRGHRA